MGGSDKITHIYLRIRMLLEMISAHTQKIRDGPCRTYWRIAKCKENTNIEWSREEKHNGVDLKSNMAPDKLLKE